MKNTVRTFQMAKEKGEKLTMLTAYDYSTARLMEEAGINAILSGIQCLVMKIRFPLLLRT